MKELFVIRNSFFVLRFSSFITLLLRTTNSQKRNTLLTFLLLTFNLSPAFAVPLQEPITGSYQCFVAGEDPFNVNAEDAGAMLEIINAQTYSFTTSSATEEGAITSSEMDTGDDSEAEAAMNELWQGGSYLLLQPSSDSSPYPGMFFADYLGGYYVLIQNNNGIYIRCESEGADIAAVFGSETIVEAPTETTGTETTEPESSPTTSPTNEALASSTPTVELGNTTLVAGNYDPNNPDPDMIPMTDTYYCYPSFYALDFGEGMTNYFREHTLEILPNNQYTFDGQAGEFRTDADEYYFQWLSGPLNPTGETSGEYTLPYTADVNYYSRWGSEITEVETPDGREVDCFQQGAREQKALLDFAIKQPTPGNYTCATSGGNPQQLSLELQADNSYIFDGQAGSYDISVRGYNTEILWSSGPLNGDTSYTANDNTGLRTLEFSSSEIITGAGIPIGGSSETSMVCQSVVAANLIPEYGNTPASPPPASAGGLDAFYVANEFDPGNIFTGAPMRSTWFYYHFLPNGYVYEDGYAMGDECTKTYPNGQSVCDTYMVQGNTVTLGSGKQITLEPDSNGTVMIDDQAFDDKKLTGPQTLNGSFEWSDVSSPSALETSSGGGTSSVDTTTYTFSSDGTYSYGFDGWSQTSLPSSDSLGESGGLVSSGSSDGDSGTYTIDGNIITLNSAKGYTKQCSFFFWTDKNISICGQEYLQPSEE